MQVKPNPAGYYERLPPPEFRAGDIWNDLPTFGLLGRNSCSGIVITPACDVANRKSETISYLPVVSIGDYLPGHSFAPEIARAIKRLLQQIPLELPEISHAKGCDIPSVHELERCSSIVRTRSLEPSSQKQAELLNKIAAGLELLISARRWPTGIPTETIQSVLGDKDYSNRVEGIIKNSFSSELFFLPKDSYPPNLSAIQHHSVALLRYPCTIPCELLDHANDITIVDWQCALNSLATHYPCVRHCGGLRPLRVGTLRTQYFSDLVSRFTTLNVRLGAPDLTDDSVSNVLEEFGVKK